MKDNVLDAKHATMRSVAVAAAIIAGYIAAVLYAPNASWLTDTVNYDLILEELFLGFAAGLIVLAVYTWRAAKRARTDDERERDLSEAYTATVLLTASLASFTTAVLTAWSMEVVLVIFAAWTVVVAALTAPRFTAYLVERYESETS